MWRSKARSNRSGETFSNSYPTWTDRSGGDSATESDGGPIPLVTVNDLEKSFDTVDGKLRVLENLSAALGRGEFVSVVGPSGCGKSTLLRIVAGIIPYERGSVSVNVPASSGGPPPIGMVFQAPSLLPWRRVLDNVLSPIRLSGGNQRTYRTRALDLLNMVGLADFRDYYPAQLSGGMQQRVALCRALVHEPALLVMDEPFGALDAFTRERMNCELQDIWLAQQCTVLFVTHNISEAVFLSDRILVICSRPGRIVADMKVNLPRSRTWKMVAHDEFVKAEVRVRDELMDAN